MLWLILVSAIFVVLLGLFVLSKKITSPQNIFFALFCAATFIWLFGTFMMFRAKNDSDAIFWDRFVYIGVVFIPPLMYHFSLSFTGISNQKNILKLSYLLSIVFLFLSRTDYFVKGLFRYKWGCHTIAQPLHHIFLIIFWVNVFIAVYNLNHFRKTTADQRKRRQSSYILFSFMSLFLIGAFAYLPAYKITLYPFPFIGGLFFVTILAYAIIAHNLLDINIVIRKSLVYSILIALLFIVSVTALFLAGQIFGQFFTQEKFLSTLLLVILLAGIFQPLYRWLTSVIDRLFFKGTLPKIAEELERSEKLASLGVLASGLAHDIKNPLAPIKTYIQNLPKNLNNPTFIDKITRAIPAEVDKITDIINQLRDFAAPPPLSISKINIHNLIDKKLGLLEQDFSSKNIIVEKRYSPALPELNADPVQLERVFLNLFLNAIDAMPNGGRLIISTEQSSDQVLIKISDTGIGIRKEDLPHIFDPFYSKGKKKGMGLGLAIVNQIIKERGGTILTESYFGKGSEFIIYLPKKEA